MELASLLAGIGLGVIGGILFARLDQKSLFDLMTTTVDKLTTSALFPGLKGIVDQPVSQEAEEMFSTLEDDSDKIPGWLDDEGPLWAEQKPEER